MWLTTETKRKIFHQLALVYMLVYALLPRWAAVWLLFLGILLVGTVEFLRIRRPEVNARFLSGLGNIHRPEEVLKLSAVFWTILGCWLTMVIFAEKRIVLPALGFLVFGDSVAALVGKKWGRNHWASNPAKTKEGTYCFAAVSALWALLFLRWPVAILGAVTGAWIELKPLPWNDNLWLPVLSGLALSVFNLLLGRR